MLAETLAELEPSVDLDALFEWMCSASEVSDIMPLGDHDLYVIPMEGSVNYAIMAH